MIKRTLLYKLPNGLNVYQYEPKQRKPIRKVSVKRAKENTKYLIVRKDYLHDHPLCEVLDCFYRSVEIHHKRGKIGRLLYNVAYFLAVCRDCHTKIENSPLWAKENGYSLTR